MSTIGNLVANLGLNASQFTSGLNKARGSLSSFGTFAATALGNVAGSLAAQAIGGIVSGVKTLGVESLKLAADAESLKVSFTTMLGSADDAEKLASSLQGFAASTPFQTDEINGAARSLLAFGTSADQIVPTLRSLGDLAAGTNQPIGDLAEIFGKAKVKGRLFMEDINQLTGRGIPVIQEFATQFGVSTDQVRKLVEEGKIGFPELQKAVLSLTSEGGKFAGLTKSQSQTLAGMFSTLKDNASLALKDIGVAIVDAFDLKQVLQFLSEFADTFRTSWLPSIVETLKSATNAVIEFVSQSKAAIDGWLGDDSLGVMSSFVENFGLYLQIGWEHAKLFAVNVGDQIGTLFGNFNPLMDAFSSNWKDTFFTAFDLVTTVFINLGENIRNAMGEIWDFIMSGGTDSLELSWKPLTDGFVSTIKKMPELAGAEIRATSPELERLYGELGKKEADAQHRGMKDAAGSAKATAEAAMKIESAGSGGAAGGAKNTGAGIALKNSAEEAKTIFSAMRSSSGSSIQDQQLDIEKQQLKRLDEVTRLMDRQIGEVQKLNQMVPVAL